MSASPATPLRVAISQRVDLVPGRDERRDALDQRLVALLAGAELLPLPVPNVLPPDTLERWLSALAPSAIVLSGGNDLGDVPERDHTERGLLDFARERGLPVLGLCRGMQMMGVWAGGALKRVEGHVCTRHTLVGDLRGNVNSFHNFSLAACPADFRVTARSEDGEIEAIGHASLRWQGWMWHPEREQEFAPADLARIRDLLGN